MSHDLDKTRDHSALQSGDRCVKCGTLCLRLKYDPDALSPNPAPGTVIGHWNGIPVIAWPHAKPPEIVAAKFV